MHVHRLGLRLGRPLVALALAFAGCSEAAMAPSTLELQAGDARLQIDEDGAMRLRFVDGLRVSLRPDAFQLGLVNAITEGHSFDPFWLDHDDALIPSEPPPGLRWRVPTVADVRARGDGAIIDLGYEGSTSAQVELQPEADGRFSVHVVPMSGSPVGFIRVRLQVDPEEAFYGLGGAPDDVMHRGYRRPMQMEPDLSIESANNEVHVPVPLLIGTGGWGVFVESKRLGVFDVATQQADLVEITYGTAEQSAEGLRLHLLGAGHPLDVNAGYYAITGAPRLPAEWAYGPLIWRDENRDQAEVEDDIRRIRELDLATSGIWIDRPYATAVNSFDFEPGAFPNPSDMIGFAHAQGLRVALWHTPYLEPATGALLEEAESRGFFPPEAGLRLNRWSDPIDFTNPEAYAWWQGLIRTYTDLGIEGFKLDYGEDLLPGLGGARTKWRFSDGRTDRTMHHDFTLLYHQVYAETLPESGGFLLGRTGRWGDQVNLSVIWPGDLDADMSRFGERRVDDSGDAYTAVGGLPTSIIMGLNLSASGFPFFGADTGGYRHSPPDNETYMRWFEQTALWPLMQVGDSSSQPPWVYTAENGRTEQTLDVYRRYARLHMRLFPYVWTYASRLSTTGRPIARPLGLAHPEVGVHPWDTYLLGDDLLVAPVVERDARERQVVLPRGRWVQWWDGAVHDAAQPGVTISVPAPLDQLPLFVRAGALIPMLRPTIDTLAPTTTATVDSYANDPGLLWVHVEPATDDEARELTLFDQTRVSQGRIADGSRLGYAPGARFETGVVFEMWRASPPTAVVVEGTALDRTDALAQADRGWSFANGRLTIKVTTTTPVLIVVR